MRLKLLLILTLTVRLAKQEHLGANKWQSVKDPAKFFTVKISSYFKYSMTPTTLQELKPIEKGSAQTEQMTAMFQFTSYLDNKKFPAVCKDLANTNLNYIVASPGECVGGIFDTVPKLFVETVGASKDIRVELGLNSVDKQTFSIVLTTQKRPANVTSDIYYKRAFETLGTKDDTIILYVEKNDEGNIACVEIERKGFYVRVLRYTVMITTLVVSAFYLLLFSSNFHKMDLYLFQFGVVYNIISQISTSIVDYFEYQDNLFALVTIIIMPFMLSYLASKEKNPFVVILWIVYTLFDSILVALLMKAAGTLWLTLLSYAIFGLFSYLLDKIYSEFKTAEVYISFIVAICLTNIYNNISSFTTSFTRIAYLIEGFPLYEANPTRYYILFCSIVLTLGILRVITTRYSPWNKIFVITREKEILDVYNKIDYEAKKERYMKQQKLKKLEKSNLENYARMDSDASYDSIGIRSSLFSSTASQFDDNDD